MTEMSCAPRLQGVLVGPDRPEVLAVPVDVEHLAEHTGVDDLFQLEDTEVVEEEVAGHEHQFALLGQGGRLFGLVAIAPAASRRRRASRR